MKPGLVCLMCFESVKLSTCAATRSTATRTRTKDNVTITVKAAVTFRIDPEYAYAAAYTVAEPEKQIHALSTSCARARR